MNMNKYGKRIREIREKHGHTRQELANKIELSESGLGKIERGERNFKPGLLEQIADIYETPLSFFYGMEGDLPLELKNKGVEWIRFIEEMEERNLTPEQIKATLEFLDKMGITKKE
jgi:transcriptional regulator with XRE-family HTH domain